MSLQRQKSSYNGGSFRRNTSVGLSPTKPNRVTPGENDDFDDAMDADLDQYLPQNNIPIIEATVVTSTPIEDLEVEEFANFIKKTDKSMKSSKNLRSSKSSRGLEKKASRMGLEPALTNKNLPKAWPSALRKRVVEKLRDGFVDSARADKYLAKYNWPRGLRDTVARSCSKIPLRFFLVDDSGMIFAILDKC